MTLLSLRTILLMGGLLVFMGSFQGCDSGANLTPEEHTARAQEFQSKGDLKSAVIELKNALQKAPQDPQTRYLLGSVYVAVGEGAGAEKELRKAVALGLPEDQVKNLLTRALLLQGNFQQVVDESIEETIGASEQRQTLSVEQQAELAALRGTAFLGLGKLETAEKLYDTALSLAPQASEALLGKANIAAARNQMDGMREWIAKILATDPEFAPGWSRLGDLEHYEGNLKEADRAYGEAIAHRHDNTQDRLKRTFVRIALKDYAGAQSDLETLKKLSRHPGIFHAQGTVDFEQGRYSEALQSFEEALKYAPDYMPALFYVGVANYQLGRLEQAENALDRYLSNHPQADEAARILALVQLRRGDYAGAEAVLKPVLARNPSDPAALQILGSIHLLQRKTTQGIERLQQLVAQQTESATAHVALGLGFLMEGRRQEGVEALKTALELDPKLEQADVLLIRSYLDAREFDKALEAAEGMRAKHPDSALPLNFMGLALLGKGEEAKAREAFQQALEIVPGDPAAAQSLASLALRKGEWENARARYEEVLQHHPGHLATLLLLAELESHQGQAQAAKALWEKAVQENPQSLPPRLSLAGYYLRTGQASEALGVLREVQSLYPNHPAFLTEKGKAELALQDPDSALATFRKLVDVQPKSAEAHYLLAKVLAMTNDAEGTHREMDKALSLDPNHFPTKVAMVRRLMVENKPQEASRLLGELQQTHPENPELIALEGWLALHQGQFEKAATIYRKALDQAPSSPLAIDLARAQWEGGDKQGAVATLQSWLQKMPADPSARLALAQVYVGLEQREAAQDAFQRLIELAPDNVPALTGLARLLQEEDPDRARSLYEEALKRQPDQLPLQMELAALEMRQGRKEDAKSRLEQALWKNPKALQPRLLLAAYYLSAGQPEEGLALLKEVEPLFPDRPDLLTALGNAQLAAGKPEAALATFKKLVKVVPKSADAHYLLAKTLAETKDIQGMRRELTAALTLQPEHFLAKLAMTRQLMVENKPEEARKLLQELQKTHPGHPELLVQEGWLASREERYGDAAAAYTEALKQVPNSQVVGLLADVQWRSGDRQGAVTTLEAWLAQHPADQAVRYLLANYYLLLDAKEAARDTYGKFLELSPDHPLAMNNLAWLLRKEDPVNALRYAERALEIAPEIAVVMDTLGTLLVEQNQVERGLQLLREASRKAPQDPAIRYHLAQALARSGNTQEAQTLVSQLLQDQKPFAEREEAQALLRQLQGL